MGAQLTLASPPGGGQSRRAVVAILGSGVWSRCCRGLERRCRGGCQGISGRGREGEEAAGAVAAARAACGGGREKEKERKEEGVESLEGGGGTGRAPHLSVAAGGPGGGAAPCPRTPQLSRPPTRRPLAAAEATGVAAAGRGVGGGSSWRGGDRHGVPQTPRPGKFWIGNGGSQKEPTFFINMVCEICGCFGYSEPLAVSHEFKD
ncbi:uncharacterized protein LOC126068466 isoform X2 [Elephas maximus indicus]|uniref:uncharacterized protein LOC126068352 isoform X4 n=1 Tax=Elephas maximus indicus TaxID=99487 RepID=UPI002115ED6C|nr:uncharacterized protein LOC126068352 isoform X4 [Elephas maximus indicus]XP_049726969.1 uncharacterized protein LOC126068466 isoform X2 [Elephas maximus indicus]